VDTLEKRFSRRAFLGAGAASGLALASGWDPLAWASRSEPWIEASIPELQTMMARRAFTSRELTRGYLERIARLDPLLGAVLETNPDALDVAAERDRERRRGHLRGPLHGVPILIKDNIATRDRMETTAGSLALVGSRVPGDAQIVARLRAAGAVLLGKANLSEWANFRGNAPFNGWSARGGFTRDPYRLDWDPCGSSSGSAVAPAANLCAAAIGTETDGSIICPSGNNLVVGLKPTVGVLSQDGIIPIAASQDTAGPMTRTVTDAWLLMDVMASHWRGGRLRRGALRGARIGVDRKYFTPDFGGEEDLVAVAQRGLDAMVELGATLVDTDSGDAGVYYDAEFTVLLYEFAALIPQYLRRLHRTRMRSLADLIAFNREHCREEMKYFGQEVFEQSESTGGDLSDPAYLAARELCQRASREGIDGALRRDRLDAIVAPTYCWASTPAAVAGYPSMSLPTGVTPEGKPAGLWMFSGYRRDETLLRIAYDVEQELRPRSQPRYLGAVPPEPADAGICAAPAAKSRTAARRGGPLCHIG
jgi:amidase